MRAGGAACGVQARRKPWRAAACLHGDAGASPCRVGHHAGRTTACTACLHPVVPVVNVRILLQPAQQRIELVRLPRGGAGCSEVARSALNRGAACTGGGRRRQRACWGSRQVGLGQAGRAPPASWLGPPGCLARPRPRRRRRSARTAPCTAAIVGLSLEAGRRAGGQAGRWAGQHARKQAGRRARRQARLQPRLQVQPRELRGGRSPGVVPRDGEHGDAKADGRLRAPPGGSVASWPQARGLERSCAACLRRCCQHRVAASQRLASSSRPCPCPRLSVLVATLLCLNHLPARPLAQPTHQPTPNHHPNQPTLS